jgi:hypothetical protein
MQISLLVCEMMEVVVGQKKMIEREENKFILLQAYRVI